MTITKQTENQKEKEFFNLWWEYLKRSDNYKQYCKIVRKNIIDKGIQYKDIKWPKKFQDEKLLQNMFQHSLDFGDIHIKTFDYWWTVRKLVKEKETKANDSKGVEVYDFEQDFDLEIKSLKREKGREPTLQEFKDRFLFYKNFYRNNSYLRINLLTPGSTDDLIKQIGKIVKEQRRDSFIRGMRSNVNLEPFLNTKVKENYSVKEHADLRMYLVFYDKYYDKSKRLRMRELMESEKMNYEVVNERRVAYLYIQKAKKIIENVELGFFPGDYQPKKAKKD